MGKMDKIMEEVRAACPKEDPAKKYFLSFEEWEKINSQK